MEKTYTEQEVLEILRKKYSEEGWVYIEKVRNATGYSGKTRTADAVAMSVWPSRGLHLHGFEVKVSRTDWLSELKKPAKAEEIAKYMDFWWVVAPAGIVRTDELPEFWGLMIVTEKGHLRTTRKAPKKECVEVGRPFLASLLRAACEQYTKGAVYQRIRSEVWERARGDAMRYAQTEDSDKARKYDNLVKGLKRFEEASGISVVDSWSWGNYDREFNYGDHILVKPETMAVLVGILQKEIGLRERIGRSLNRHLGDLDHLRKEAERVARQLRRVDDLDEGRRILCTIWWTGSCDLCGEPTLEMFQSIREPLSRTCQRCDHTAAIYVPGFPRPLVRLISDGTLESPPFHVSNGTHSEPTGSTTDGNS